ncbi:MAG: hypothetical protein LC641_09370 [Spirochaeta sp.]|nr:hypothetical protein [Spirochaeta sp.]
MTELPDIAFGAVGAVKRCDAAQGSLLGVRRRMASRYCAAATEALHRGEGGRAVALLVNAVRCRKRGPAKRRLLSLTNEFGMLRKASYEEDARHAFFGVQLSRYLARKRTRRIATPAEADMLVELLLDTWQEQWEQIRRSNGSATELIEAFGRVRIVFPYVELPPDFQDPMVEVDFDRGERLQPERRCWCGSGLSHFRCHGRIQSAAELGIGKFCPKIS